MAIILQRRANYTRVTATCEECALTVIHSAADQTDALRDLAVMGWTFIRGTARCKRCNEISQGQEARGMTK